MNDDKTILEIAKRAINDNRQDEARSLLNPLLKRNVTEAFYLASKVATTQEQALKFLRHALTLDPDNTGVRNQLFKLEMLYENKGIVTLANLVDNPQLMPDKKIEETVALFEKYGWDIVAQRENYAQFIRKPTLSIKTAFFSGLIFHIVGMVWLILIFLTLNKVHASVETNGNDLVLTTPKGELGITYPEQTIVFLERTQGKTLFPSLISNFIGVLIATIIIGLSIWQFDFLYEEILPFLW